MTETERAALEQELADIAAEKERLAGPSVTADVAKSAAYAVPKAAAAMVGLPRDVQSLADMAKGSLQKYLPEWMNKADIATSNLPIPLLLRAVASKMPSSGDVRKAAEEVTGPWYEPQTGYGRATDVATQAAATMGRNLVTSPGRAAAIVGGITGGTEGAGLLSGQNPWARAAGGAIGGGIPAVIQATKSVPGTLVRQSLGDLTPEQIARGQERFRLSREAGMPLMPTEALDRGHILTSGLLAHAYTNPKMAAFLEQRPQQTRDLVESALLSQTGERAVPTTNAARAAEAASNAIEATQKRISAATKPFYGEADVQEVSPQTIESLLANARYAASADKTGILSPLLNEYASRFTALPVSGVGPKELVTDIGNLDRIRKFYRDRMALPVGTAEAIPKEQAKSITGLNVELQKAMTEEVPQYAKAVKLHEQLSKEHLDPLLASGVGKIAGKGYDPAAYPAVARMESALTNIGEVRPENIKTIYSALNKQDKQAFPGMVQTVFENELQKAAHDTVGNVSTKAAAKFANALVGSKEKNDNFNEMLRGTALATGKTAKEADTIITQANRIMDLMKMTGRTPDIGSMTAGRSEMQREMAQTFTKQLAGTISLTPFKPGAARWSDWVTRKRWKHLAEVMTSKDGMDKLLQMARYKPDSLSANYLASQIIGIEAETKRKPLEE